MEKIAIANYEFFSDSSIESKSMCRIVYEPCGLKLSDVAIMDPKQQRFYVNHMNKIEKRTCVFHKDTMCLLNAAMQISDESGPNSFDLECVLSCGAAQLVSSGLSDCFCLTHDTDKCFAVVNYHQQYPQREPRWTNPKPLPTESTYSLLMLSIPSDIKIFHDDKETDSLETPGLMRFMFALDHYGKTCDPVTQMYCREVWERINKYGGIHSVVKQLLPQIVPNFYDCVRVHRAFFKIWENFNHSSKQCLLPNCVCLPCDESDSEVN